MRAQRLRLENWRVYQSLDVEFGDFTVVRGPNGSGKTGLLDAIVFALVGADRGDNDINQAADHLEVSLWFQHGEAACEITRKLIRGGRQTATLRVGDLVTTGNTKVTKEVVRLLKVDERLIRNYVFVPQWEIFSFINDNDTARSKTFGQLFGTEKAEWIWKALGEVKLPDATVTVDGQAAEEDLAAAATRIAASAARCDAAAAETAILQEGRARRLQTMSDHRALDGFRREVAAASLAYEAARKAHAEAVAAAAPLEDEFVKTRDASSLDIAWAWTCLQDWAAYENWQAGRSGLDRRLQEAERGLEMVGQAAPTKPAGCLDREQIAELQSKLTDAAVTIKTLARFVAACDPAQGVAACPTCGSPTASGDVAERLVRAKEGVVAWTQYHDGLRTSIDLSSAYYAAHDRYCQDLAQARRVLDGCREALAAAGVVAMPGTLKSQVQEAINQRTIAERRRTSLEMRLGQLRAERTRCEVAERVGFERMTAAVEAERRLSYATLEAFQAAQEEESRLEAAIGQLATARAEYEVSCRLSEDAKVRLARFHEERQRFWRVKNLASHMERVRARFHRENLPAHVHRHCLNRIRHRLDKTLERFNKPFRVKDIDGVRFNLQFADGRVHGEDLLSGGEKVVFAIAFRFGFNSTFASELGMLCLDEPTAGLDEDTLGCLEEAFRELRDVSRASGLQLILVTHDRGFDAQCDRAIDLARPELPTRGSEDGQGNGLAQRQAAAG